MVQGAFCWTPRQCAALAGIVDITLSTTALIYVYYSLSFNSGAAECLGLNSLYRYESQNGSHNESYNEFIQLTFRMTAVRRIFIPPALCALLVGIVILAAGLLNKYWITLVACILTSIMIGGLIPMSVGLLAMEIHWLAIVPLLISIIVHLYFLYILIELAEALIHPPRRKSMENVVYYTGPEDIDEGIIMKTETVPSIVPVIVISKPRLPTPAPDATV